MDPTPQAHFLLAKSLCREPTLQHVCMPVSFTHILSWSHMQAFADALGAAHIRPKLVHAAT